MTPKLVASFATNQLVITPATISAARAIQLNMARSPQFATTADLKAARQCVLDLHQEGSIAVKRLDEQGRLAIS
jgi:hypothetical protein